MLRIAIIFLAMMWVVICRIHAVRAEVDSLSSQDSVPQTTLTDLPRLRESIHKGCIYKFRPRQLLAPLAVIGAAVVGINSDWAESLNKEIKKGLQINDRANQYHFEDWVQYAPAGGTYALKVGGVKGKHDYVDLTILTAMSYAFMAAGVNATKYTVKKLRPDGSTRNSFPSGHTATAFVGAELLRREYWDTSPWIGVAGYAVAGTTAFFRMYHNRHWFTDVIAGAGMGALSVQVAYWLYPVITRTFCKKRFLKNTNIFPYATDYGKGVSLTFNL